MGFKQYLIEQSFFKRVLKKIKKVFSSIFSKMKFGETKKIKLNNYFETELSEKFDAGARALLGFYSEMVCAVELNKLLTENNIAVLDNNIEHDTKTYKKTKLDGRITNKDISITESKGKHIAKQMFDDIIASNDILLVDYFDILRTGVPGVRADITIKVKKKDEKDVKTLIEASLKSLSSNSLTIYSSTALGFLWKVVLGKTGSADTSKFDKHLVDTIKNAEASYVEGNQEELNNYRSELTSLVVEYINKYSHDKSFIERMKESAELEEGAMDVYLAIGKTSKIKTISSKNSKNFEKLLHTVRKDLYIVAEKTSNLGLSISFISKDTNTAIISFKGGWGVTSSKTGTQKLNIMGSAKQFE